MNRTWTVDGLSQWPFAVSLSDNVLNASKHDLIQITTRNKSSRGLLSCLIVVFRTSAGAPLGRRLSYAVHFNEHKSSIQCDRFLPVMSLSWHLCRILKWFVASWRSSNLRTWTSASVNFLSPFTCWSGHTDARRAPVLRYYSGIRRRWGRTVQSNLRSDRPVGVAGPSLSSDWLKATSFRNPSPQWTRAGSRASGSEPRAERAGQIEGKAALKFVVDKVIYQLSRCEITTLAHF